MSGPEDLTGDPAPEADAPGTAYHYRWQAQLSRAMAAQAASEGERSQWRALAEHWDALADPLERLVAASKDNS